MLEFSESFQANNYSLNRFFSRLGSGYVIPNFQRGYEWRQPNIDSVIDDVCEGLSGFVEGRGDIHYFGTLILLPIHPMDYQPYLDSLEAQPSNIELVIDGQQRISTFALIGCTLYENLFNSRQMLLREEVLSPLRSKLDVTLSLLRNIFSFDQPNGQPRMKPKIIREYSDHWTTTGPDTGYQSTIASFLAQFIRVVADADQMPGQQRLGVLSSDQFGSLKPIIDLVRKEVKALRRDEERAMHHMPDASTIVNKLKENPDFYFAESVLTYLSDSSNNVSRRRLVEATVRLYAFCHFLFNRCGFTGISPRSEDWAFDLFQTLNTTGVPLTVLETFKPLLISRIAKEDVKYEESPASTDFANVERYITTEQNKEKRINELLTSFVVSYSGEKLSRRFSTQRRWLAENVNGHATIAQVYEFARRLGDHAIYYEDVKRFAANPAQLNQFGQTTTNVSQQTLLDEAATSAAFLMDAGNTMAHPVLSRSYAYVLRGNNGAATGFIDTCRATAAFFTLWRSTSQGTSGLPEVYRRILKEDLSWMKSPDTFDVELLKLLFQESLESKNLADRQTWIENAKVNLRYNTTRALCRFALLITSHDTVVDPSAPGLMKVGTPGVAPHLKPAEWTASHYNTIEHIAPQQGRHDAKWDVSLDAGDVVNQIGNLVLLSKTLNQVVSNRSWSDKLLLYRYLAATSPDDRNEIMEEAEIRGFTLSTVAEVALGESLFVQHLTPIVAVGEAKTWDAALVSKRTERICEIVYDRMWAWLM